MKEQIGEVAGYEITIKEFRAGERVEKEYQKLHDKIEFDSKAEPQYGYVEEVLPFEDTVEIYCQTVKGQIDLKNIIDAFNA